MVQGIETDNKKYKHKKRNDTKWLSEDLNEIRKTTEKYIDSIRPEDEKEINGYPKKSKKKTMTIDRIIAIILLGIFGPIALVIGIYLNLQENYVIGILA
jgi:hypothetical protein